jgi:hypothetical protein
MAVVAIVKACGLVMKTPLGLPAFDTAWQYLFQQIEASIAVCLVSLTAFRQLFISHGPNRERSSSKSWYASTIEGLKSHKRKAEDEGFGELPSIPSATLSGVRTFIQGGQRTRTAGDFDEEEMLAGWGNWPCQVLVTNHIKTEICEVRFISG